MQSLDSKLGCPVSLALNNIYSRTGSDRVGAGPVQALPGLRLNCAYQDEVHVAEAYLAGRRADASAVVVVRRLGCGRRKRRATHELLSAHSKSSSLSSSSYSLSPTQLVEDAADAQASLSPVGQYKSFTRPRGL
jgi:hypothetical protein